MPRSTTRPSSRTRISSTWSRPARRCVIRSVERPAVRASRSAVRASAPAGSRCSTGSSRMRMEKSARRARATATRWRCPPESRKPAGPTLVPSPAGSPASQSPRPTRASTSTSSSSPAERRPTRRFSAKVVAKRCGLCSTSPTTRRTSSEDTRSIGTPLSVASPPSRGRKRTRTSANVDLPAPLGPTSATRRPGARSRSTPRQDGSPGTGVARPHRAQAERVGSARCPGKRSRVLGIVNGCGGIRGGEHAVRLPGASAGGPGWRPAAAPPARRRPAGRAPARPAEPRRDVRRGWRSPRG